MILLHIFKSTTFSLAHPKLVFLSLNCTICFGQQVVINFGIWHVYIACRVVNPAFLQEPTIWWYCWRPFHRYLLTCRWGWIGTGSAFCTARFFTGQSFPTYVLMFLVFFPLFFWRRHLDMSPESATTDGQKMATSDGNQPGSGGGNPSKLRVQTRY